MIWAWLTSVPFTTVRKEFCSAAVAVELNVAWSSSCSDWAVISRCCSPSAKTPWVNALNRSARCWAAWSLASDSELSVWTSLTSWASEVPCAIWLFRAIMLVIGMP
jgi:hypothetical protein